MPVMCTICHNNLPTKPPNVAVSEDGKSVVALNCGHIFHRPCVKQWFRSNSGVESQGSCPSCRKAAQLANAISVFPHYDPNFDTLDAQAKKVKALEDEKNRLKLEMSEMEKMVNLRENSLQREKKSQETLKKEHEQVLKKLEKLELNAQETKQALRKFEKDMNAAAEKMVKEKSDLFKMLQRMEEQQKAMMAEIGGLKEVSSRREVKEALASSGEIEPVWDDSENEDEDKMNFVVADETFTSRIAQKVMRSLDLSDSD